MAVTSPPLRSIPSHSRITLLAAGLAAPVASCATGIVGLLLILLGLAKLLPSDVAQAPEQIGATGHSAHLLLLATGGVITTPWGAWLIGAMQVALGIGLLVPRARALAALGCLLASATVVVGIVYFWGGLVSGSHLNEAGIAMIILAVLLLAGAALGMRSAAKQICTAA